MTPPTDTPAKPKNRLRELRERHGLKVYDVAALIRRDTAVVYRYETGEVDPPVAIVRRLAAHYSGLEDKPVTVEYLLGWDRDENGTKAAAA